MEKKTEAVNAYLVGGEGSGGERTDRQTDTESEKTISRSLEQTERQTQREENETISRGLELFLRTEKERGRKKD